VSRAGLGELTLPQLQVVFLDARSDDKAEQKERPDEHNATVNSMTPPLLLLRGGLSTVSHAYHPVHLPPPPELTIGNTPSPPEHPFRCLRPRLVRRTGPAAIPDAS